MTGIVYNIARLRKIPFFTFDQLFPSRMCLSSFAQAEQAFVLHNPSVHNALWMRASLSWGNRLSHSANRGVG